MMHFCNSSKKESEAERFQSRPLWATSDFLNKKTK